MNKEVKETLRKQLMLLSERSDGMTGHDLVELTQAMCEIADRIPNDFVPSCGGQST